MTLFFTVISMIGIAPPGPLDAYRLNFRETKAEIKFEFSSHLLNSHPIGDAPVPRSGELSIASPPFFKVAGEWSCDGMSEHWIFHQEDSSQKSGKSDGLPDYEAIFDQDMEVFAYHHFKQKQPYVFIESAKYPRFNVFGPTNWMEIPFLAQIETTYKNSEVTRKKTLFHDHPTESELYTVDNGKMTLKLLVLYDPSIGYVPRYLRGMSYKSNEAAPQVICKEVFLLEAKPCSAGGFIPTEWCETFYTAAKFDPSQADRWDAKFSYTTKIIADHFKAGSISDLKGNRVVMREMSDVRHLATGSGDVALPAGSKNLNIEQLTNLMKGARKSRMTPLLKKKSTTPAATSTAQGSGPSGPTASQLAIYLSSSLFFTFIGVYFARRANKIGSVAQLSILVLASHLILGCGARDRGPEPPQLGIATETGAIIYKPGEKTVDVPILVSNSGSSPIKILNADGGCSCRKFDDDQFPLVVGPRSASKLTIKYTPKSETEVQTVSISFALASGTVSCPLNIAAFPRHLFSPDSIALSWYSNDGAEKSFELMHREVVRSNEAFEPVFLVPEMAEIFSERSRSSEEGFVEGADQLKFKDTTYTFAIKNGVLNPDKLSNTLKTRILLKEKRDGMVASEVPILMSSIPYLSTVPDRVILGNRPARVFILYFP
ncbi:hypothetical protein [Singulisphaera sp. PoT]|uniref:hypothetical protein n=1 Tax=Singulisphaera sp. PoT TaxID=3411797 RepID=UPI003BF57BF1